jgi:hypothetical protein
MKKNHRFAYLILLFAVWFLSPLPIHAEGIPELSNGQTIYVPAYSHIYSGDSERPFLLTVTVSVRNINMKHSITVTTVDYYETQGSLLKKFRIPQLL